MVRISNKRCSFINFTLRICFEFLYLGNGLVYRDKKQKGISMGSRLQLSVRFVHSFDEIIIALNGILLRKTLEFNARRYFSSASFHKNADVKLFLYLPRTTTFLPFLLSLRSTFVFRSRLGRTSRPEKWFGLNNTLCSRCLKNDRINGNVYRRCRGRACSNR